MDLKPSRESSGEKKWFEVNARHPARSHNDACRSFVFFLWSLFFFPPFGLHVGVRKSRQAGVRVHVGIVCVCVYACLCSGGCKFKALSPGNRHIATWSTMHTSRLQCQSVSGQRRNPDAQKKKKSLGASFCSLVPLNYISPSPKWFKSLR